MDHPLTVRLRPGVRDAFDEETCRMRLHEIGDQIVPRYPFNAGMQEIYAILLGEYGKVNVADAISVLHELLEDESYEGNIWRSWRHGWRHRNVSMRLSLRRGRNARSPLTDTKYQDNILDPFVPAVGDFVLPPPTSKPIRALKGANFIGSDEEIQPPVREARPTHGENRPSYISSHSEPQSLAQESSVSTGSVVRHKPLQEVSKRRNQLGNVSSEQYPNRAFDQDLEDQSVNARTEHPSPAEAMQSWSHRSSRWEAAEHSGTMRSQSVEAAESTRAQNGDVSDNDSQQEFADVTGNVGHVPPSNLLRFEMMAGRRSHMPRHRRAQSDPTGIVIIRPVHSGDYSSRVGRNVTRSRYLDSEHRAYRDYVDELLYGIFENVRGQRQTIAAQHDDHPRVSSQVLETLLPASVSDAESAIEESFDGFQGHGASSARHQEATSGEDLEFLSDRVYGDDMPRMSLSAVKTYTVERAAPSMSTISDHASIHSWRADNLTTTKTHHRESSIASKEVLTLAPREAASPTPGRFPIDSLGEDEVSQIEPHKCKPKDHEGGVTCSRISCERYPIDGHGGGPLDNRRTSVLGGGKGTQPNQLMQRGRSFLQHIPKIFRKGSRSQQAHQQSRHARGETSSVTGSFFRRNSSKSGLCSTAPGDSPPRFGPKHTIPTYSLDGACDEDDTASTMPAVDLNKALPPQPSPTKNYTSVSSRTDTPSLTHSHESKARPSTASTGSSGVSRVSSKKKFHRTAHELVNPDMAGSRDPSPLRQLDADKFLVASKYDPLASPNLPDT